jgi:uncharacterized protein
VIRLRGHHLLCLQTYKGLGYSPRFIAGMDAVAARLNAGEPVKIVDGPDDICAGWADDPANHCREPDAAVRDARALAAFSSLLARPMAVGASLPEAARRIAEARTAFAAGTIRQGCAGCPWMQTCDAIAADGFAGTRLR